VAGLAGVILLAAVALRADQFEDARAEALKNLGGAGGRDYDAKLLASFEERHGKALAECAPTVSEVELDPFTVLLELGTDGHAKQILLRPANGAAVCLRWSLRGSTFPKPPRAGFWAIEVDPRSRRMGSPANPSVTPPANASATSPAPGPTAASAPSPAAAPVATPPAAATSVASPAPAVSAPAVSPAVPAPALPTSTPARPPAPRPTPPPAPSGGVVDVRFASVAGAEGDDALRRRDALDAAQRHRLERGVVAGVGLASLPKLDAWRGAAAGRFVASLAVHGSAPPTSSDAAAIRQARRDGRIGALEILAQGEGLAADDPKLEPWWSLAEELDLPVSISLGPPPREDRDPRYRVALGDPLRLEPVLVRHPRLRVDVGQAGWPFADSMAAILRAYPQVFVDTGGIALALDRRELHAYLERLAAAGFADRILFASGGAEPDQLARAIEAIESAAVLTPEQKRAILHDNAARWIGATPAPAR